MNENTQPHPLATKIRFSGNCPACEMKGEKSEMLLNNMDFFECPECHLQVTAFPDAVAVLKWRGEGEFRQSKTKAIDGFTGQPVFASSDENEIMPNKQYSLRDHFDLEEYIATVSLSYDNWKTKSPSYEGFDFSKQEEHLESIEAEYWENLIDLWSRVENDGISSEPFQELTSALYDRGVIFKFPWQNWTEGLEIASQRTILDKEFTLLDISKYFTFIYRSTRLGCSIESFKPILSQLFCSLEKIT